MYLDKLFLKKMNIIGSKIIDNSSLNGVPQNIDEMATFIQQFQTEVNDNTKEGLILAKIFFELITSIEVRDRKTTARCFEDIFSYLFGSTPSDEEHRSNPPVPETIIEYDKCCMDVGWNISSDLSGNKREKSDLSILDYTISIKTLKGQAYNEKNELIDNDYNNELNVGSFSYRALLKGILPDDVLDRLSDRKGGLGSKDQLNKKVFSYIVENNMHSDFYRRLSLFFPYVYTEDVYIVLKSHYKITFILIPQSSFVNSILHLYEYHSDYFADIWHRWENNNLRFVWTKLIQYMGSNNFPYYEFEISLSNIYKNSLLEQMEEEIEQTIDSFLN